MYFLAVDAGGSKTDFVIADETAELARVRVGSIKTLHCAPETAAKNFASALVSLREASGIDPRRLSRTCIGTSGFSAPAVADWVRDQYGQQLAGELLLCGDEEIALEAAFQGGPGVLVLAGTGSNAIGRDPEGRRFGAGGWGPILADEGSGHWIGLEAVRQIFRAADEQQNTMLEQAVLLAWNLQSRAELIQQGNRAVPSQFAELVPVVIASAARGDRVAEYILRVAGQELARLAKLVLGRMQSAAGAAFVPPRIAVAGGILGSIAPVRDSMAAEITGTWPEALIAPDAVDPVQGALWKARRGKEL
jgi:glucosamine kinase